MVMMHRASADPLPGRRALATAARVLLELEELGADATGAFVFRARDRASGAMLVERGRVCWVGANGLQRRLTDLLIQETQPAPDRREIAKLFEQCRRDGRPLGERLVEAGMVHPDGLRRALLQHSVEAMILLAASPDARHLWVPHRSQRYDAAFTFAPAELMATVAEAVLSDLTAQGRAELDTMLGGEGVGVALERAGGTAAPLVVAQVAAGASVRALVELAAWAAGALDLGSAVVPRSSLFVGARSDGSTFFAWRRGSLLFGAACSEPTVAACVVARHARRCS